MRRGPRKSILPRALVLASCALALAHCDSNSPTSPETLLDASGSYAGQAIVTNSTPSGHCFTEGLELIGGSYEVDVNTDLSQLGVSVVGDFSAAQFAQDCQVEGSLDGNGNLFIEQVDCTPACAVLDWPAAPGETCLIRVCSDSTSITGQVSSDLSEIQGQLRIEWSTFDADTDEVLGRVIATGSVDLELEGTG